MGDSVAVLTSVSDGDDVEGLLLGRDVGLTDTGAAVGMFVGLTDTGAAVGVLVEGSKLGVSVGPAATVGDWLGLIVGKGVESVTGAILGGSVKPDCGAADVDAALVKKKNY